MNVDGTHIPHFMPGGVGSVGKLTEDEEVRMGFKISKYINELDDELKDRFKALKALQDLVHEADEEEQKEIREMEIEFENKYKEIYKLRDQLVTGKADCDMALVEEFNVRAEEMKDEDYDKMEVVPCDVKAIQNTPKGVSDFWLKSMLQHPVGSTI